MSIGIIKWFDKNKNIGFIKIPNYDDLFINLQEKNNTKNIFHKGDIVKFDIIHGKHGPQAINIIVLKQKYNKKNIKKHSKN